MDVLKRSIHPLEKLEQQHPFINSNFCRFCSSHGISTVEDILVSDFHLLTTLADQHPESSKLIEGMTQVLSVIAGQHQPWRNGMELLEDATRNKHVLSTGCQGIDLLLQGGLRKGELTEFAGPSPSGKTQVCLCIASHVADSSRPGKVLFLDTGNSFSSRRIASFVISRRNHMESKEAADKIIQKILGRIISCSVHNIFTLVQILHQLESCLKQLGKERLVVGDDKLCLLVVDSISSLVTPILGGKHSHGRSLMVYLGFLLKKLASENNIAVIVTNHTVGGDGGGFKPALGESWKGIPHARLMLSHDLNNSVYIASVLKHSMIRVGVSARFVIPDSDR